MSTHLEDARRSWESAVREMAGEDLGVRHLRATVGHIIQHLEVTEALSAVEPDQSKAIHAVAVVLHRHRTGFDERYYSPSAPEHKVFAENAAEILAAALPHLPAYLAAVADRERH